MRISDWSSDVCSSDLTYIELVRGTPIVVQVLFIYFALPVLADIRVNPMTAAITAIVVNAGAYIAEIMRGSFLSVHKGLNQAGLAVGLPLWKVLLYIVCSVVLRSAEGRVGTARVRKCRLR